MAGTGQDMEKMSGHKKLKTLMEIKPFYKKKLALQLVTTSARFFSLNSMFFPRLTPGIISEIFSGGFFLEPFLWSFLISALV